MSFDTYAHLQTEILNWLDRDDTSSLAAKIPSFITLAEAQIARDLRRFKTIATITIAGEQSNLPSDLRELVSLHLVTDSASQDTPLINTTMEELAYRRAQTGNAVGRPLRFAVLNDGVTQSLLAQPVPDGVYSGTAVYYIKLVPLSVSNTSNTVLVEAPDLYLFGALKEAELYLENDERMGTWEAKYQSALASLIAMRDREEWMASKRPLPLGDRVFS